MLQEAVLWALCRYDGMILVLRILYTGFEPWRGELAQPYVSPASIPIISALIPIIGTLIPIISTLIPIISTLIPIIGTLAPMIITVVRRVCPPVHKLRRRSGRKTYVWHGRFACVIAGGCTGTTITR